MATNHAKHNFYAMNNLKVFTKTHKTLKPGFTLVELLTVIAIIGLLAGILIPTVGGALDTANRAKTRTQISQLKTAIDLFHSNYHYYPLSYELDDRDTDVRIRGDVRGDVEDYISLPLTAQTLRLKRDVSLNPKGIPFYEFAESEFNERGHYIDAFGNTEFHILLDGDGDKAISTRTIDKREARRLAESLNQLFKIRGSVHIYVYPDDINMIDQLITTWD